MPKDLSDREVVRKLDEFIYTLKAANGPIALKLRTTLREFVEAHGLDSDPHLFASLPEEAP